jgi:type I restriction enzyme, S subunit
MTLRVHPDQIVAERPDGVLGTHRSWTRVRLAAIADVLNGFAFPSSAFATSGSMPLIRIRDVGRATTDTWYSGPFGPQYVVKPGSLIVGMDGDFRADKWLGPPALLNQRVCQVSVRDPSLYHPDFLRYVLPGYLEAVSRHTSAVTVKHLSSETVKELPLPLPPRLEQERIVAAIEEQFSRLDAGVAALERVRQNLKRLRASVLQAGVTGQLVAQENGDPPAEGWLLDNGKVVPATGHDGHQLPAGWARTTIGELKTWSLYGPRFSSDAYVPQGIPVLRTTDITQTGRILVDQAPKLALTPTELEKYRVNIGDILITRTGSIGTVAFIADDRPAIPGAYLILYRFGLPVQFSEFLFFLLQSPQIQSQLQGKSAGIGRPNLNAPSIDGIDVAVPPWAELLRIVEAAKTQLEAVDRLVSTLRLVSDRARASRSSILEAAFSGKLVPQDPTDEPASVLLERIVTEQASFNSRKPSRTRNSHTKVPA